MAERWIAHLLAAEVKIEPLVELQDATFTWYVGLDAEAERIGDALWKGDEIDESTRGRVIGLYRLDLRRSRRRAGEDARRADLCDNCDDCRQAAAPQAAESRTVSRSVIRRQ